MQIIFQVFLVLDFPQADLSFQSSHITHSWADVKRAAFLFYSLHWSSVAALNMVRKSASGLTCIISLVDAILLIWVATKWS